MIYELNHFGIMVSDIRASLDFYEKLDARVVFSHSNEGGVNVRYLQIAGGMIELVGLPTSITESDFAFGIDHLAFISDDLDADYRKLIEAGCAADGGTRVAASGAGRLGFLRRPDGARIELLQREEVFRTEETVGIIAAFDHYACQVEDIEEAKTFFGQVVGLSHLRDMNNAQGKPIRAFFGLGYDVLGLRASGTTSGNQFPHFVLRVESVDRTLQILAGRGIHPAVAATDSLSGNGRAAFLEDPDGVRIELLDRPDLRGL